MINTRFWDDDYASNLDPIEKLLFLYFLTNTSTNICGIYEIPIKKIAVETGIDKEMVLKIIERFRKDSKIFYYNGWVGIKNFIKHQNQKSPQVQKGIESELNHISSDILHKMIGLGYGIDTLSHLNLNLNLNSNINLNTKEGEETSQVNALIDLFKDINPSYSKLFANKTQRLSANRLLKQHGFEKLAGLIKIIPQSNKDRYAPVITTPLQLEDKLGQLIAYGQKKQANLHPII
jgi:hypothetical protein